MPSEFDKWKSKVGQALDPGGLKKKIETKTGLGPAKQQAVDAATRIIKSHTKVATTPAEIVIKVGLGKTKPKDAFKRVADVIVDAQSAETYAKQLPSFFVMDLAKAIGGEKAERLALEAVSGIVVTESLAEMVVRFIAKPGMKPEDVLALPFEILLASTLEGSAKAFRKVAKPIPGMVKQLLKPAFGSAFLEESRYALGKVGITLPEIINGYQDFMGSEHAVALPGIIIFSDEPKSDDGDLWWWAHELQHLVQYKKFGVEGFARRYLKNYKQIEDDADAKANSIFKRLGIQPVIEN